ncbi:hypothetical protein [Streptomyces atroolivaceus]|uniref:hypothetical protein n=1 Tax=Streptomyces atroolivaceus TaxID=66869 RepID=UPI0032AEF439
METSWDKDGVGGWIQTSGGGAVRVSFAVWIRDVDESGYFDDVEAVYEQGEQALHPQRRVPHPLGCPQRPPPRHRHQELPPRSRR